eukprot:TRINITY_DN61995_c0_g1_i1.p1 TRINITY_DN61995_c0_g1~~TRINITY_DN61995_c0_g1_i1.p1  ORF type:complete len:2510 (-),score=599.30 TRINITY_DN61995_c0_g1_i1:214-7617(-)
MALFGGAALGGTGLAAAAPAAAAASAPFKAEVFEELHAQAVVPLVQGGDVVDDAAAFAELRSKKDALARPFAFRGREDTVDVRSLAQHVMQNCPRLATEPLVMAVDAVSKSLKLHQQDCCALVEKALDLPSAGGARGGAALADIAKSCAAMYYRECHFQALCIHDLAQNLTAGKQGEPCHARSVAFFAMLGGRRFVKAIFEALAGLLRDLNGEKTNDQMFQAHASTMIQLLVETLLAYFYAFSAASEEAEHILALLPHVVTAQHAPLGQGFTVSDLDLILREEHADISTKLCLALVCMFGGGNQEGQIDISRIPEDAQPATLRPQDYMTAAPAGHFAAGDGAAGTASGNALAASPLGQKMKASDYWNEESQLGHFLAFSVGGVLLGNEQPLRHGYVHWNVLHFILHDILLSHSIVGETKTSRLVVDIVRELLAKALLPVGRQWVAIKKLEAQAINYRLLTPDALQLTLLQLVNRLCRLDPSACDQFRDVAVHCTDTFHLSTPQGAVADNYGFEQTGLGGGVFQSFSSFIGAAARQQQQMQPGGAAAWIGAPPSAAGTTNVQLKTTAKHDSSALYAEILDFLATLVGRGSMQCARLVCQKLMSHSNQWFNWKFLVDTLTQVARAAPSTVSNALAGFASMGASGALAAAPNQQQQRVGPISAALCHLVAAVCSNRLWTSQPPPQPSVTPAAVGVAAFSTLGAGPQAAETFGGLMLDLLGTHPDHTIKAACLGALSQLEYSQEQAKSMLASLNSLLPMLLSGVVDVRGSADGLLAIELLRCALRLVEEVPLNKGRYGLDLMPMTHVVVQHIYLKVLADTSLFASPLRYWRLAGLCLQWLRLVLRGPLPLGVVQELNATLLEPYAENCGEATLQEVAMRTAAGNATAFAFRCMLALDSPVFSRVLYLTLLRGRGAQGLQAGKHGSLTRVFMEKCAEIGLDILRILLQRDVLFRRLYGQQAAERAADGAAASEAVGGLRLLHQGLFSEFPFAYPPTLEERPSGVSAAISGNPFAGRRLWQSAAVATSPDVSMDTGSSGQRSNPSYVALLLEFVSAGTQYMEIAKNALFIMMQCALREPDLLLQTLKLEPWRLHSISADLHALLLQPEEPSAVLAAARPARKWDKHTEAAFIYEVQEMDVPPSPEASCHLGAASFLSGQPVCAAVVARRQLCDDALVQNADIAAWARSSSSAARSGGKSSGTSLHSNSSADAGRFRAGYLRGFEVESSWLDPDLFRHALQTAADPPPPVIAASTCRRLAIRTLSLLTGGVLLDDKAGVASKLAQALLGLDPDGVATFGVDIDIRRLGQSTPLEAVMQLLENPPPTPLHLEGDSGAGLLAHRHRGNLQPDGSDPTVELAVQQHVVYETALGIVSALLSAPSLRDVTLRFVCHAWPSRYKTLREYLAIPWAEAPLTLRRVLLSEACMLLRIVSWEMRLVPPLYASIKDVPEDVHSLSIEGRQRQEMKRAVAEHLRDVVRSLVMDTQGGDGEPAAFLVAAALRLSEACQQTQEQATPHSALSSPAYHDALKEMLRASSCACLAPSEAGPPSLGLALMDPHVFLRMLSPARLQQRSFANAPFDDFASGFGAFPASMTSNADAAAGAGMFGDQASAVQLALQELTAGNTSSCVAFFAKAAFQAFAIFASAAFYHLVGGIRPSALARDPRAQTVRAHLEALMPSLAPAALSKSSPLRLELLAELASVFIATMQQVEGPAPLTFAYHLFCVLRGLALHPLGTPASRRSTERAMLLLVQRMLPTLRDDTHDWAQAKIDTEDMEELPRLIRTLLASAGAASGGSLAAASLEAAERYRYGGVDALLASSQAANAGGMQGSSEGLGSTSVSPDLDPDMAMMLLATLLVRVPRQQLPQVFRGADLWRQLVVLIERGGASSPPRLRPAVACVAGLLCQTPQLAAAFFECGGLAAILQGNFLQASILRADLAGLPAWEGPHPAPLLGLLQVLVAALASLPAHRLLLQSVLGWLEGQNGKVLVDLLQWVNRLPLVANNEPQTSTLGALEYSGTLRSAEAAAATAASSSTGTAAAGKSAMLLVCTGAGPSAETLSCDRTLELTAASLVAGDRWWCTSASSKSASSSSTKMADTEERERFVALAHRCALLTAELWALLSTSVTRCTSSPADPIRSNMDSLANQLEPVLLAALARSAALSPPAAETDAAPTSAADRPAAAGLDSAFRAFGAAALGVAAPDAEMTNADKKSDLAGLYPTETTRLAFCLRVLQAMRCDAVAQQVQGVADGAGFAGKPAATQNPFAGTWGTSSSSTAMPSWGASGAQQQQSLLGAGRTAVSFSATVVTQARARVGALSTVLVCLSDSLLALRFVGPSQAKGSGVAGPDAPHLQFDGSRSRFRQLVVAVEMTLHLLAVNLAAVVLAIDAVGASAATPGALAPLSLPASGAPRLVLVAQYLRLLRQFKAAVGGAVVPIGGSADSEGSRPPLERVDLSFAACLAERVEALFAELQSF